MKTNFTPFPVTLKKHIQYFFTTMVLLLFMVFPSYAQFYTKITSGALTDTKKTTYCSSWADYNSDGWDDMLIVDNSGGKSSLFVNNGDGTFTPDTLNSVFTTPGPSIACSWGDYNNDGNVDLYICNIGASTDVTAKNFLFRNDGNSVFTKITEGAIVNDQDWSMGASWTDYDNDGFLDLYVANFQSANCLYHNNGGVSFTKITEGEIVTDNYATYAVSSSDYDNDGYMDFFAVNYFLSALPGQNDCLYHNNGDGTFTKNTTAAIANDGALTQGASWGDYNNDGFMDIFLTNNDFDVIKHNFLYKNEGNGIFSLVNAAPSTTQGTSFGSAWLDVNNDGYLDIYVSNNGSSSNGGIKRKNFLFINNGDETFANQPGDASTTDVLRDYCSTISDYNHDGYPDIFTPSYSTTVKNGLYQNNGGANNWITTRLVGMVSNKSAIGARIRCYANGMAQTREVSSTTGQYCGSSFAQTFGIGTAISIDSITINWPSGIHQKLVNPTINQILTITEANNLTDITSFSLPQQTGPATINYANYTVTCEVAYGTSLSALMPTILVSNGATINPASMQTINFSNGPVIYTVTAQDQVSTQQWSVSVAVALNSATDIITFIIPNQVGTTSINSIDHTILATIANGSNLSSVTPTITLSAGASVDPASGIAVDFTNSPVSYTVTAENGTSQQVWAVSVLDESALQNDILTFEVPNQIGTSVINSTNHTVSAVVMSGTPLGGIAPSITISQGSTINPPSGTGVNYSSGPVSYTVTSFIGTPQVWVTTVTEEIMLSGETEILTFVIPGQAGTSVINAANNTVEAVMPYGTNLSALIPTIAVSSGATINPASGAVMNFVNGSVNYTVTAENGTDTQVWAVTVTNALNNQTDILSFTLDNLTVPAVINPTDHTITAEIELSTGLSALTPVVTVSSGATVTPASGGVVDFSNGAVAYTVTAENGVDVQVWNVTVTLLTTGLNETSSFDGLNIYPNPTSGLIHINVSDKTPYKLEVANSLGQIIHSEKHENPTNAEIPYAFPQGSKGTFIVRIITSDTLKAIPVIVK